MSGGTADGIGELAAALAGPGAQGLATQLRDDVWTHIRAGRAPAPELLAQLAGDHRVALGHDGAQRLAHQLQGRLLGAGPLEALLADPLVTDVAVNGDGSVWVDRGSGMLRAPIQLGEPGAVRALAVRLAAVAGRRLDDAAPFCDAVLPSGVRLHAILPPLVADGAHVTLRIPLRHAPDLDRLGQHESGPAGCTQLLRAIVASRVSFVVTGGTGAGKTTLLAAMLSQVPPAERLVTVEDVRELAIAHPHVVRLEGRPPNVEGAGEVPMVTLVRQALRMRPDRIVVGEVRGAEVRELLAALNTGHQGGCGTLHANSADDVVARFEALGALAGLRPQAVHSQLASAVQAVVHVCRLGPTRLVDSISVLDRPRPHGPPVVVRAWLRGARGAPGVAGPGMARLRELLPSWAPSAGPTPGPS